MSRKKRKKLICFPLRVVVRLVGCCCRCFRNRFPALNRIEVVDPRHSFGPSATRKGTAELTTKIGSKLFTPTGTERHRHTRTRVWQAITDGWTDGWMDLCVESGSKLYTIASAVLAVEVNIY